MKDLISIIIPIYNCEEWLERCVDSVFNQTYKNVEIILIDDGSSDSSWEKCIQLKEHNQERITIFRQKNNGPSAARNKGIELSKGKYFAFIDADDLVSCTYISDLAKHEGFDVVVNGIKRVDNNGNEIEISITKTPGAYNADNNTIGQAIISCELDKIIASSNSKLYKTTFIKENHISYPEDIRIGEDLIFNLQVFSIANSIYIDTCCNYLYYINSNINSLTKKNYSSDVWLTFLSRIGSLRKNIIHKYNITSKNYLTYYRTFVYEIFWFWYFNSLNLKRKSRRQKWNELLGILDNHIIFNKQSSVKNWGNLMYIHKIFSYPLADLLCIFYRKVYNIIFCH